MERTRNGRNFATRIVRGFQCGQIIANTTVSFASAVGAVGREGGDAPYEHGKKMPAGLGPPNPAELETYQVEGPYEIQKKNSLDSLSPLTILIFRTNSLLTRGRVL